MPIEPGRKKTPRSWAEVERLRAEAALRQVEERQTFLLDLTDRLRLQKNADQIEQEAARLLGELLGVSVVYFGRLLEDEVEVANEFRRQGMASQLGRYSCQIRSTPVEMARQGQLFVVADSKTAPISGEERERWVRAGIGSLISVPVLRHGSAVASMAILDNVPRHWSAGEIPFLQETAERTWSAVERARAEAALRESDERHTFLLRLSDALRPLSGVLDIQSTATRMLAEYLGVAHAYYYELSPDEDLWLVEEGYSAGGAEWPNTFRLSDYGDFIADSLRRGVTVALNDTEHEPGLEESAAAAFRAIGSRAAVAVPLVKGGRLVGALAVHQPGPRKWAPLELRLIEDVADRTWAAAARARAEEALREADRKRSDLLAMLGQELRNPLVALEDALRLLRSPEPRPDWREITLPFLDQQVDHLNRLVGELLAARLERGKSARRAAAEYPQQPGGNFR